MSDKLTWVCWRFFEVGEAWVVSRGEDWLAAFPDEEAAEAYVRQKLAAESAGE